ncbi:MAG: methyltransferase domain-containing protein [Deltaproteobacteria bacterium]|nr:methyltransferase domain-containing protein [Deltaproteobacteria bacterium]
MSGDFPIVTCPVRGCGLPLDLDSPQGRCAHGHLFDRARSGYFNLLQPQDRKSRQAGDSRAAVQARQRVLDGGLGDGLRKVLLEAVSAWMEIRASDPGGGSPELPLALDVGCGTGFFLAALHNELGLPGWGVDLSAAAIDVAAKRYPGCRWLVANADRKLPFSDGSFDLVLTITSRKNPSEFRRLLRPDGRLIAVVAGGDDLAELREKILGQDLDKDRAASTEALFGGLFCLEREFVARDRLYLERPSLVDLLTSSYRGARFRAQEKLSRIDGLVVTLSYRLLCFRPASILTVASTPI